MKKNRYLLCLLLGGLLLYFAVPKLSITSEGVQGIFSITWLAFALIVVAGNLTGLLYAPNKRIQRQNQERLTKRKRSFN